MSVVDVRPASSPDGASRPQEPVRFLVVGMQRSGTTLVHQLLAGHPDVASNPREAAPALFHDFGATYFNTNRNLFEGQSESALGPDQTLIRLFDLAVEQAASISNRGAAGLKVATGRIKEAEAMADAIVAHAPTLRVVHIRREDPIAACVSFEFASKNKRFQIHDGEDTPQPRIQIHRTRLVNYIHNWWAINAAFDRLSVLPHHLRVDYERDLASGALLGGETLFDFIGVEPVAPTWVTLKKSLPPKEETVVNLAECEDVAAGVIADLSRGAELPELFRRHGPSLPRVAADLAGQAMHHPATVLRRSYLRPLSWKLLGK